MLLALSDWAQISLNQFGLAFQYRVSNKFLHTTHQTKPIRSSGNQDRCQLCTSRHLSIKAIAKQMIRSLHKAQLSGL